VIIKSTESVKEPALKTKGQELQQNSQSKPLKPCPDRAKRRPELGLKQQHCNKFPDGGPLDYPALTSQQDPRLDL